MEKKFSYKLLNMYGFQHCHGEDCDEFFIRPIYVGKEMMTFIAHIPPHGGAGGDEEEMQYFEQSIYVLDGTLTVNVGEGRPEDSEIVHKVGPKEAFGCLRGEPHGKWNETDEPVSYICTYTYVPPMISSPEEFFTGENREGRKIFSPEDLNKMAGDYLNSK